MERIGPGEFCWVELATPSGRAGFDFYSRVFGWGAVEQELRLPGRTVPYAVLYHGGRHIGSVYEMMAEQREGGLAPHWLPYLSVDSLERVIREGEDLGATSLLDPLDVLHLGRMAILEDP